MRYTPVVNNYFVVLVIKFQANFICIGLFESFYLLISFLLFWFNVLVILISFQTFYLNFLRDITINAQFYNSILLFSLILQLNDIIKYDPKIFKKETFNHKFHILIQIHIALKAF